MTNYLITDAALVPGISVFKLPLTNIPQTFILPLSGVDYNVTCKWNDADEAGWVIDLADANNVPLAGNIPLIVGADLLSGLEYLGVQGQLFVYTDGNQFLVPTLTNLGVESNVYFTTSVVDVTQ